MAEQIRLLNQKQVAEILGKSTAWCERARWNGTGPPYRKIGAAVRYPLDALNEWIGNCPLQTSTSSEAESG